MDGVGEQLWVCMSLLGSTSSAWLSTVTLYVPPSVSCSASPSFFTFLLVFCCGAFSRGSAVRLLLKCQTGTAEICGLSHLRWMNVCRFSGVGRTEQSLTGSFGMFSQTTRLMRLMGTEVKVMVSILGGWFLFMRGMKQIKTWVTILFASQPSTGSVWDLRRRLSPMCWSTQPLIYFTHAQRAAVVSWMMHYISKSIHSPTNSLNSGVPVTSTDTGV